MRQETASLLTRLTKEVPNDGAEVAPKRVGLSNLTTTVYKCIKIGVFLITSVEENAKESCPSCNNCRPYLYHFSIIIPCSRWRLIKYHLYPKSHWGDWLKFNQIIIPPLAQQPNKGHGRLILEVSRLHTVTHYSRYGPLDDGSAVPQACTWQHTTLTTDKYPCLRRGSNPKSHQSIGRISST
jgi:hypothetical protein